MPRNLTTMTNIISVPVTNPYHLTGDRLTRFKHQVRMELVVGEKTDRVNVAGILRELMQRAVKGNKTTSFADTGGAAFSLEDFPTTATFAKRLSVEQVTHGTNK